MCDAGHVGRGYFLGVPQFFSESTKDLPTMQNGRRLKAIGS